MSIVNIRNVELLNNPAKFKDQYQFRIKFEAIAPLAEDLEWKLIYVGSAQSEEYDQELDSCMVGPIPAGVNVFDFTASAPQPSLLPSIESSEILGVTVIILTASYRDIEFVRVGYYVNTYYEDEARQAEPPKDVDFDGLCRNVLVEKPKVTRFSNPWDNPPSAPEFAQTSAPADSFDAPLSLPASGNAADNIFNSPLPPPIQRAPPKADSMEVDQPMA